MMTAGSKCNVIPDGTVLRAEVLMEWKGGMLVNVNIHQKTKASVSVIISCFVCTLICVILFS